jgi:exopolysaccharide biosynthesis predicted pyruvyltransferase EpsI
MHLRPRSVTELRDIARERLAECLGSTSTVALVNFPNHGNPGDPAIWLGSEQLLRSLGVRVRYRASHWSFDPAALRRAMPNGTILINGGGNFGDLYAGQQATRELILREMVDYPIVQLPQSIRFVSTDRATRMANLINAHGRVTLMVRDEASRRFASDVLQLTPVESPDHVFGLGPISHPRPEEHQVSWLTWRQGATEWREGSEPPAGASVNRVDWIEAAGSAHDRFDATGRLAWRLNDRFHRTWESNLGATRRLHPVLAATFDPLARRWMSAGLDLLASSHVLVTNKLHGHILCTLLGKPHVVLDNSYGKVLGAVDRWTGALPGVHVAHDADEAWELARDLMARPITPGKRAR